MADLQPGCQQGFGKAAALFFGLAQQMEGQPLGGARADAGQSLELLDQPGQRTRVTGQRTAEAGQDSRQGAGRECCPPVGPPVAMIPLSPIRRLRSSLSMALPLLLAVLLVGCAASAAGLNRYQSADGRYAFLYPTGWTRVAVSEGPQVVFHDLINSDETLSLVIAPVDPSRRLEDLGSAIAVGERLRRTVIAPEGSGRAAELVEAGEREVDGRTFYDLEYRVHLADRDRHELATAVVEGDRLYTLAASTNEVRWPRVNNLFHQVVSSFTLNY